jgi:hypothetical protein
VHSNLATWCPSWGKSPWLPTTTPPLAAAYPVTISPWLCFYLSTMYPFLACSCSPSRPVIHSPQLVLLLLSCSLPSLHLLSMPCCENKCTLSVLSITQMEPQHMIITCDSKNIRQTHSYQFNCTSDNLHLLLRKNFNPMKSDINNKTKLTIQTNASIVIVQSVPTLFWMLQGQIHHFVLTICPRASAQGWICKTKMVYLSWGLSKRAGAHVTSRKVVQAECTRGGYNLSSVISYSEGF